MTNVIEIVIKSKDESKPGFETVKTNVHSVGDVADKTSVKTIALGTSIGNLATKAGEKVVEMGKGIGEALFKTGETMEAMEQKIRRGTGASGEDLEGLFNVAKKIGTEVPNSFDQVGDAVTLLSQRMGLTGKPLEDMATQFLNLSRITGTDLKGNIESATKVFESWNVTASDQPKVLDEIYRASQQSGVGVDKLTASLASSGPQLRAMGFSVEESTAMLAQFDKTGIDADSVMGGLRMAVAKVGKAHQDTAKDTDAVNKAQQSLNETLKKHAAGSTEVIAAEDKLKAAQDKVSTSTTSARDTLDSYITRIKDAKTPTDAAGIAVELFGKKGVVMADAIRSGRLNIDEMVNSVTSGTDTINKASLATMSFSDQWQLTKNRLMVAFQPAAAKIFAAIGDAMEKNGPQIAKLADSLGPLLANAVQNAVGTLQMALPIIQAVLTTLSSLGPAAGPLILALVGISKGATVFKTIKGGLDLLPESFVKVALSATINFAKVAAGAALGSGAMIAGAVAAAAAWIAANAAMILATGGIILVIGAVIAIVILLVKHWDWVKAKAAEVWGFVQGAWIAIKDIVIGAVSNVIEWLKANWPLILAILGGPLGLLIKLVIDHWNQIVAFIKAAASKVGPILLDLGRVMLAVMTGGLSELVILIVNKWNDIVGFFHGLPGRLLSALRGMVDDMLDLGRNIVEGLWHGIQNGWSWLEDQVSNLAHSLLDAAKHAIGIHSKSKAFEDEMGAQIPPGIAAGVYKTADVALSAVRNVSANMLNEASSAVQYQGVIAQARPTIGAAIGGAIQPAQIIKLEFKTGGSPIEELFARIIRDYVKVNGGDVQTVFGRS